MTRQQALDTLANNIDLRASLIWLYDNGYEVINVRQGLLKELTELMKRRHISTLSLDGTMEEGDG